MTQQERLTALFKEFGIEPIEIKHVINGILALLLVQHQQVEEYNNYWLVAHDLLIELLEENAR